MGQCFHPASMVSGVLHEQGENSQDSPWIFHINCYFYKLAKTGTTSKGLTVMLVQYQESINYLYN